MAATTPSSPAVRGALGFPWGSSEQSAKQDCQAACLPPSVCPALPGPAAAAAAASVCCPRRGLVVQQKARVETAPEFGKLSRSLCANQGFAQKSNGDGLAKSVQSIPSAHAIFPIMCTSLASHNHLSSGKCGRDAPNPSLGQPSRASGDLPSLAQGTSQTPCPKKMVCLAASEAQVRWKKLNPALSGLRRPQPQHDSPGGTQGALPGCRTPSPPEPPPVPLQAPVPLGRAPAG